MTTRRHQPAFDWLISRSQMTKAMRLQAVGAGIIGKIDTRVPVARRVVDGVDITPALQAALDEATEGRFSTLGATTLHVKSLQCVQTTRRDLLDPSHQESDTAITGLLVVEHDAHRSVPMSFSVDPESGAALLDDAARSLATQWLEGCTETPEDVHPADAA